MARVLSVLGALALLGGAAFAFLVGGVVNWLACENAGTPACSRQDLASAQFILAISAWCRHSYLWLQLHSARGEWLRLQW